MGFTEMVFENRKMVLFTFIKMVVMLKVNFTLMIDAF